MSEIATNTPVSKHPARAAVRAVIRGLSSPRTTVACLLLLCVLVFWGTLYQAQAGLYAAQERFFRAWVVFVFGFVPLPAVKLVITALSLNLLLALPRLGFSWRRTGLLLTHSGVALLIMGAGFTHYLAREGMLSLRQGESSSEALILPPGNGGQTVNPASLARLTLPATVRLIEFTKKDYRGTSMAADYQSRLFVQGPGISREIVVSMNRPFRWKGYTFFQSSYAQQDGIPASTLAVVSNPGRHLPYAAGIVICLGLLVHLVVRLALSARAMKGRAS